MSRRKKILVAATTGLITTLVGEIYFRLNQYAIGLRARSWLGMADEPVASWPVYDPDLVYRNRPNWEDHNADGMRDHPTPRKSRFRLLMLGDSIGYEGESIEDTYPGQLEMIVNRDATTVPCDVLNAGTKGYTTYQELVYLEKYGFEFLPDTVGLGFCVNDLHRFLHAIDVVDGEIATGQFSPEALRSSAPKLLRPSLFLSWFWVKSHAAMIHFGLSDGFLFDHQLDVSVAWKDDPWTDFEAQLSEMVALSRNKGASFFVVGFPYSYQYLEEYLDKDRTYVLKPQERLRTICSGLGVPFLDLYTHLSQEDFLEDRIHLAASGRRKTAEAIAGFLKSTELLPTSDPK